MTALANERMTARSGRFELPAAACRSCRLVMPWTWTVSGIKGVRACTAAHAEKYVRKIHETPMQDLDYNSDREFKAREML